MADTDQQTPPGATDETEELPDKLYFRIGEVASLVGVDSHVLRYWENEFALEPHRSSSGQRLYRKSDLALFMRIKHLLHEEGYTIAGARRALREGGSAVRTVDFTQIREALRRVERLREEIAGFRVQLRSTPAKG